MTFSKTMFSEFNVADKLMDVTALPNTSNALSGAFLCDGSRLGLEIVGLLHTAVTVPSGKTFSVELHGSDSADGSFVKIAALYSVGAGALTAGKELFRFAPVSTMPPWKKLKIISDSDLSSGAIDVFMVKIGS